MAHEKPIFASKTTLYTKGPMAQKSVAVKSIQLSLPPDDSVLPYEGVGLVAPFDFMLDAECWRWLPPGVPLFVTRTPQLEDTAVTVALAAEVSGDVAVVPAIKSLLAARPASVAYACTSGSFVGGTAGEHHLQKTMLEAGAPEAVTTSGALVQALKYLGIQRLAIATPYNEELTDLLSDYLHEAGFEVVSSGHLDREHGITRISYDAVKNLAEAVDVPEAEAIFFSCTNLHTFDVIDQLEKKLGKTMLSANQVTMWAALQAANLPLPAVPQNLFRTTVRKEHFSARRSLRLPRFMQLSHKINLKNQHK
jgi:maleate isomerase